MDDFGVADLNAKDSKGKTATMHAAQSTITDRGKIVAMLREADCLV